MRPVLFSPPPWRRQTQTLIPIFQFNSLAWRYALLNPAVSAELAFTGVGVPEGHGGNGVHHAVDRCLAAAFGVYGVCIACSFNWCQLSFPLFFVFFFFFFFSEWAGWGRGNVGNRQTAQDIHPLIAIFSAELQSPSSNFTLAPLQKSLDVSWAALKSRFDMPGY